MKTPRGLTAIGTLAAFILIFVLIGVLWLASGGPSRPISHAGPFLSPPTVPGVDLKRGRTSAGGQSEVDGRPIPELNAGNGNDGPNLLDLFFNGQGGAAVGNTSPYSEYVTLSKGTATQSDRNKEYVTISVSKKATQSVTLTGWTLESKLQLTKVSLGSAAPIFYTGQINNEAPITAGPGSTIYIVTGRAPNGAGFRINTCSGYLEQFQDYAPKLDNECPSPKEDALRKPEKVTSVSCVDFIESLDTCEIHTGTIPADVGGACRDFVQNDLTYNGCVAIHRNDPDFFKNEWRVFLNRDQEVWNNTHEQILLWDENGKLIDSVTY